METETSSVNGDGRRLLSRRRLCRAHGSFTLRTPRLTLPSPSSTHAPLVCRRGEKKNSGTAASNRNRFRNVEKGDPRPGRRRRRHLGDRSLPFSSSSSAIAGPKRSWTGEVVIEHCTLPRCTHNS